MKQCNKCQLVFTHIKTHAYQLKDGRTRGVYADDLGRQWNAATCPMCTGKYSRKKKRQGKAIRLTARLCTVCNKPLQEGRHFFHEGCGSLKEFSTEYASFIYG